EAEQLKIALKRSRQETHISPQRGDDVRESEGESEEEKVSFDPIPRTPEDSEKESDDEEEQESRL
nr:hypothetical protein [Tanacetum cinerariifolium]